MRQNPDWQVIAFFALLAWSVLVVGVLVGVAIWRHEIQIGDGDDD